MKHVWQPSFVDPRVRDSLEYEKFKNYIWQNPVKRLLVNLGEARKREMVFSGSNYK